MDTARSASPRLDTESQETVTSQPGSNIQLRISRTPFGRSNRQSVVLPDVPTLESLAMRVFLQQLERTLEGPVCRGRLALPASVVLPLRCVCHERVPARLRQRMLDHVLASGRVYNTVDMRLLEVLLGPDIRRICVRHVRKWYRERFLLLLKEQGTGLQTLYLEEIQLPPLCEINLAQTLTSMSNLTHVSLRFACDDASLWSLGRTCPNLEELDVEGSIAVTDQGVQTLCLRGATLPVPQVHPSDTSIGQIDESNSCGTLFSMIERCICIHRHTFSESPVIGISWWRASLMRRAKKNPCCATLRLINVTSTKVTNAKGLVLIESCCPQAKVIIISTIT